MGLRRSLLGFTACLFLVLGLVLLDQNRVISGIVLFSSSLINLLTYGYFDKKKPKLFIFISLFNAGISTVICFSYFAQDVILQAMIWLIVAVLFVVAAIIQFLKMRKP